MGQPLALPHRTVDHEVCHMCGTELGDRRIVTRDTQGNPRRFDSETCYTLWANHNLTQFTRRTAT